MFHRSFVVWIASVVAILSIGAGWSCGVADHQALSKPDPVRGGEANLHAESGRYEFQNYLDGDVRVLKVWSEKGFLLEEFRWSPSGELQMAQHRQTDVGVQTRKVRWLPSGKLIVDQDEDRGFELRVTALGEYTEFTALEGMEYYLRLFGPDGNIARTLTLSPSGRLNMTDLFPGSEGRIKTDRRWLPSGQLVTEQNRNATGEDHGRDYSVLVETGTQTESYYRDGVLHGSWTQWDEEGRKIRERNYVNGRLSGSWREWTADGQLMFTKQMENDQVQSVELPEFDLPIYYVSTALELRKAIGSGRRIVLKAGDYDLSALGADTFLIRDAVNLSIEAEDGGQAHLFVNDPWDEVIWISDCTGITLRGLKIGHEVPATADCISGVLIITGSEGIRVEDCCLYGSGTVGLRVNGVVDLVFDTSRIEDCSVNHFDLFDSRNIRFINSSFRQTGNHQASLFWLSNVADIHLQNCTIAENWSEQSVFELSEIEQLQLEGVVFDNNWVRSFSTSPIKPELTSSCTFRNNGFAAPGETTDDATLALYAALEVIDVSAVDAAIANGANVNFVRPLTALIFAIEHSVGPNIVKTLLANGADPNQPSFNPTSNSGEECLLVPFVVRPLHAVAIRACYEERNAADSLLIVNHLLDHGADIDGLSSDKRTPLMEAVLCPTIRMAEHLLQRGANVNARDDSGIDSLMLAVLTAHPEMVRLLLANRADPTVVDSEGNTLLHMAVTMDGLHFFPENALFDQQVKVVEALVSAGVDPTKRNKKAETAADLARHLNFDHLLPLLESPS